MVNQNFVVPEASNYMKEITGFIDRKLLDTEELRPFKKHLFGTYEKIPSLLSLALRTITQKNMCYTQARKLPEELQVKLLENVSNFKDWMCVKLYVSSEAVNTYSKGVLERLGTRFQDEKAEEKLMQSVFERCVLYVTKKEMNEILSLNRKVEMTLENRTFKLAVFAETIGSRVSKTLRNRWVQVGCGVAGGSIIAYTAYRALQVMANKCLYPTLKNLIKPMSDYSIQRVILGSCLSCFFPEIILVGRLYTATRIYSSILRIAQLPTKLLFFPLIYSIKLGWQGFKKTQDSSKAVGEYLGNRIGILEEYRVRKEIKKAKSRWLQEVQNYYIVPDAHVS